ncbi:uncharacterized protein LOC135834500 isoform X26 [Planococcus citri]|uniref:uncharacterized protein LOC135834500 isoform X26 n=1 Tax=Planococcus citri TaxID=170843 RepID=UPI0031F768F1
MTETVSNVYDLIYPSPATLKEISCNALVTGLWRLEVENRVPDDFKRGLRIDLLKNLNANIPSPVKQIIDECINKFITSKTKWLDYHHQNLCFDRNDTILLNFSDFIIDRDGTIHYTRTAKRMMTCDRLSNDEKFKIACMYCFEDDIKRIWPSVSEKLDLNEIQFHRTPELFYWICMLRNEPDRIPNPDDFSIDDFMLEMCPSHHWSSVEYFWNRISPESRLSKTIDLSHYERESFVRLMLPKLSDQQLEKFVLERGSYLIHSLVTESQYKFYVSPTWMYIRNKMEENDFTTLILLFMLAETNDHIGVETLEENSVGLGYRSSTEDETLVCCEIWKTAPDEWKQSTVRKVLSQHNLFVKRSLTSTEYREIRFLSTLLLDASFKERNDFWKKNWHNLIVGTRGKDLHLIMKLCFEDENDIAKFKETSMYDHESIDAHLRVLLSFLYLEKLNDLLIFCCPDTQKRMDLKQRLLRSCFLSEPFILRIEQLTQVNSLFNDFINDAFDDAQVAADFKNNLVSFRAIKDVLKECIYLDFEFDSNNLIRFIDTFVSNEEVTKLLKRDILEYVRNGLLDGSIQRISAGGLQIMLVWCLGDEEEVTKFKKSVLSMSDFFAGMSVRP